MGAQMVKEVASQASDAAGDGTTTATVLAQSIVNEGLKSVAAGMNPMDLKRGIDKAVCRAVESARHGNACEDNKQWLRSARSLLTATLAVGEIIAEAMDKVGKEGVITVEEGQAWRTSWTWLKVCSSIAVTCRHTSSTIRRTCSAEMKTLHSVGRQEDLQHS